MENWVNLKDQRPPDASRVLVFKKDTALLCCGIAWYADGIFYYDATLIDDDRNGFRVYNITHWMPIPEFPK